jgi:hypothetical protein
MDVRSRLDKIDVVDIPVYLLKLTGELPSSIVRETIIPGNGNKLSGQQANIIDTQVTYFELNENNNGFLKNGDGGIIQLKSLSKDIKTAYVGMSEGETRLVIVPTELIKLPGFISPNWTLDTYFQQVSTQTHIIMLVYLYKINP